MARPPRKLTSHRDAILREMGLGPLWRLRSSFADSIEQETTEHASPHVAQVESRSPADAPDLTSAASAPVRPSSMPTTTLAASRTPSRVSVPARPAPTTAPPLVRSTPTLDPERATRIATFDWDALEADIRGCRACVLCERRKQAVPGVGDRQASWMFVGEGPGSEEDQRGEPFVGQAGRLLDNMLAALGLNRSQDVYIANAVKCRPPHNRTPEPAEVATCLPYLERQIELIRPKLLVALGRPAALALLGTEISIAGARGRIFDCRGIPVVVTYHPAYLLRNPQDKGKAWADLCFARRLMADQVSKI